MKATAVACANIAFIKYWGNRDAALRIPWNNSLSMNLDRATTTTSVAFEDALPADIVVIDGQNARGEGWERVVAHLDRVRTMADLQTPARVVSRNSFPVATGMASSASAFAALTLAAAAAAGLDLPEDELSRLARLGSGSACRSVPGGFVEWTAGTTHETSCARQIAPPGHWDLRDVVAVVSCAPKKVGSSRGHALATTSPFFQARLDQLRAQYAEIRQALLARDLETLGRIMEEEAISLHVIAMTSQPPIFYWLPATLAIMRAVQGWRAEGLPVYFTLDAGPNVHTICHADDADEVARRLANTGVVQEIIVSAPGPGAHLVEEHL